MTTREDSAHRALDEAFRGLRASVKFAHGAAPVRSLLVVDLDQPTSSGVAERLATAFAQAGDRCILLDVRRGAATDAEVGGFDALLLRRGGDDGLPAPSPGEYAVLPAGRSFTPDMLAGDAFPAALQRLTDTGAFVIIACDAAPEYADAIAIAPRADAVVLVVAGGRTRRAKAVMARDALERVGARLLGVVLVEPRRRWYW